MRLREERIRVDPHQGRFATRIGVTQKKQSQLENGDRDLRAEYLAAIAAQGVDVLFVLTGQRSEASLLSSAATQMVDAFEILTPDLQSAALSVVKAMGDGVGARRHPPTGLNEMQASYTVDETARRR